MVTGPKKWHLVTTNHNMTPHNHLKERKIVIKIKEKSKEKKKERQRERERMEMDGNDGLAGSGDEDWRQRHRVVLRVCNWLHLFQSDEFLLTDKERKIGLLFGSNSQTIASEFEKLIGSTRRVLPLFCQLTSCEGKLVVVDG
jgi:hypothetical protein